MKKKILVWETLSTVSGGQKMTLKIIDLLSDTYDFCCLIPGEGRLSAELEHRGIPYIIIGDQSLPTGVKGKSVIFKYAAMSVRCIRRSLRVIKEYDPDILYCPGPAALPWSAICGSLKKKPVVWHLHHIFLDGMTGKLLNMCSGWKSVRRIVAVSDCVGDQIRKEKGRKKTATLYNPVDVDKYASGSPVRLREEIEEILGVRPEKGRNVVISQVALIQRLKKQDLTLKVIKELAISGIDVIGLFPGEVREEDYMEELRAFARELGVSDRVIFWGRRDDVPDILAVSDLIMIPSGFEGFPLAGLEAAAAGVPAAVCNETGALEYAMQSGCGIAFQTDDPVSAADAVKEIISRREKLSLSGIAFSKKCGNDRYKENIGRMFSEIKK